MRERILMNKSATAFDVGVLRSFPNWLSLLFIVVLRRSWNISVLVLGISRQWGWMILKKFIMQLNIRRLLSEDRLYLGGRSLQFKILETRQISLLMSCHSCLYSSRNNWALSKIEKILIGIREAARIANVQDMQPHNAAAIFLNILAVKYATNFVIWKSIAGLVQVYKARRDHRMLRTLVERMLLSPSKSRMSCSPRWKGWWPVNRWERKREQKLWR